MTTQMTIPEMEKRSIPASTEGSITCDSSAAEMERNHDLQMSTSNMD